MNYRNILLISLTLFFSEVFADENELGSVVLVVKEDTGAALEGKPPMTNLELATPSYSGSREELTRVKCTRNKCIQCAALSSMYVFFGSIFFGTLALHATGFI